MLRQTDDHFFDIVERIPARRAPRDAQNERGTFQISICGLLSA